MARKLTEMRCMSSLLLRMGMFEKSEEEEEEEVSWRRLVLRGNVP